jgi:hypothetical protein
MSGADIRIGRLVIEGRVLTASEAARLGRLIAEALGSCPLPAPRAAERVSVPAAAVPEMRPAAGQFSLERLAGQVADGIRRKLA